MPDDPATDEHQLVMAMPRRELFSVSGFVTQVEMRVIESLADESWFAAPKVLRDDLDSKEVRLGMLIQRAGEVLIDDGGVLLHATPIPPETATLGEGLRGLRELARVAARELLEERCRGVQLVGYFNEDGLPETRPFFILVYLVQGEDDAPAPPGMSWIERGRLGEQPLDAASSVVAAEWLSTQP